MSTQYKSRGCKREIALEALLDGKGIGRESRVVRMQCAGWLGHMCTLKTIPNMGYLLYRGRRLQRTAHHEGVFHRMVKRKQRTKVKRTTTWTPVFYSVFSTPYPGVYRPQAVGNNTPSA